MKSCPVCTTELLAAKPGDRDRPLPPRQREVWLDRGESDRLIERAAGDGGHEDDDSDWGDGRRYSRTGYREPDSGRYPAAGHPPPKKKGFFGRMFDFD